MSFIASTARVLDVRGGFDTYLKPTCLWLQRHLSVLLPGDNLHHSGLDIMPQLTRNLGQLISIGALSLSFAVLVCLAVVFAGCTSSSSPADLHFLKVSSTRPFSNGRGLQLSKGKSQ